MTIATIIRKELKAAGIKARCRMAYHNRCIQIYTWKYGNHFTSDEIYKFCTIAKNHGMTMVRGNEIKPDHLSQLTGHDQFDFYIH